MPAQSVDYLGIQIDTVAMQLSLPPDKLTNLNNVVLEFSVKTRATKKELQVLAGHLSHAATVVSGGRTFSRRVINVIKRLPDSHVKVPLPSWFFDDIKWWCAFLKLFNGKAAIVSQTPSVYIATDSSMSGFGAINGDHDYLVGSWNCKFRNHSLAPITSTCVTGPPCELNNVVAELSPVK